MTSAEIKRLIATTVDANDLVITDKDYDLPTKDWIVKRFGPAFTRNAQEMGVGTYHLESNDCDDFARLAACLGRICHRLTRNTNTALAFGWLSYIRDDGQAHAINFAITELEVLRFFEPQQGLQEIHLSPSERGNVISVVL